MTTDTLAVEVLIVDDEPAVVDALDRALVQEGYAVASAGDGRAALERVARANPESVNSLAPEIARLRVSRVVTAIDAGRILNPLAGRNQIEGAVVMGIGMSLFEETSYDPRNGAPINSNLADYIVSANADVPSLDVHFVEFPDTNLNELGARGIGEIGLAGMAAAIANAVYHATGVRVRELPIKIEDLIV